MSTHFEIEIERAVYILYLTGTRIRIFNLERVRRKIIKSEIMGKERENREGRRDRDLGGGKR